MQDGSPDPRPRTWRVLVAALLLVGLSGYSLAYHDGVVGTTGLASLSGADPPIGRFRSLVTLDDVDVADESVLLRDDSGSLRLHWNHTVPRLGERYVVAIEVDEDGPELMGLARPYVLA